MLHVMRHPRETEDMHSIDVSCYVISLSLHIV